MENRAYYDEFAPAYERQRGHGYHALVDDLEADLALRHCRGRRVLEVGCGTGLILGRLAAHASKALGIDLSGGMLERARARGLAVAQATATRLPFADGAFDVVVSFKVLAHVEAIGEALDEMSRVTRPGGRLLLEFYNRRSVRWLVKRLAGPGRISDRTAENAVYTRFDTLREIRDRLPPTLRLVRVHGIRIFTPAAFAHRVPLVRSVLAAMERAGRDRWPGRWGGFLVVELERLATPSATSPGRSVESDRRA